ncbi:MAG: sigma-70 family RNA polymerase sigma factor [Bacteroidales bacterium]|nr:sigma-70 family RNA polymerase sigma factor [Bacteroidales bacterium]
MEINPHFSKQARKDYNTVCSAIEGNENAYTELMGRYKDAIYYLLLKMTNNKSDAEDLTMEAFGKAFKNIKQYSPKYAFSTWLFKIASNNCIDFLRKKKSSISPVNKQNNVKDSDIQENYGTNIHARELDPEEELIKKQKVKHMREIVKKLKPRYRRLIELRYFKEYSYEEISKELELPIGTVKAQLFRARELLFNLLKNNKKHI